MSGPRTAAGHRPSPAPPPRTGSGAPGRGADPGAGPGAGHDRGDTAGEVVRWAAFSCVLVPVVLLWYGASLAGAVGTALGLAAVTGVCRVLLRQSERGAARLRAEERVAHRGRHQRTGSGAHRGNRHPGGTTPVN
ncbi:hypothetical protein ACF061_04440 [Streptomyces sp. NPDC015220]|uniref:hypothetical protein n=1 Tax=Streptomyces sp. NPDC015220 TaxID=3364947 RepID=UPI0036FE8952